MTKGYPNGEGGKHSLVPPLAVLLALSSVAAAAVTGILLARHRPDTGAPHVPHSEQPPEAIDPGTAAKTVAVLPLIAAVLVAASLGLGLLLVMIERNVGLAGWDDSIERWAVDSASDGATDVLTWITYLGGTWVIVVVSLAVAAYATVRTRDWAAAGFLTLVVGGQLILSNLLKWVVERARPTLDPLSDFSGASFPSGHTTAATATYLGIALVLGLFLGRRGQAALMGAAAGLAVAVACTRVFLGVHWLTDVIGGIVLGLAWFAIASMLFGGRRLTFGAGVKEAEHLMERHEPA
jgi:membrane-associated phospholipid phosphatase